MGYLGDKQRSELMRFWLVLDAAPTGTPTITITRGQGTALDTPISTVNMTQGADALEWYYNYTTEAAAQVGLYTAKFIAVVTAVTRYDYDQYDVTVYDADDVKAETALIKAETDKIGDIKTQTDLFRFTTDEAAVIARVDEKIHVEFIDYISPP